MPTIEFRHAKKSCQADAGDWLYDVVQSCDGGIPFSCKAGACGTCATEVLEGLDALREPSARELRTLTEFGLDPQQFRLPCLYDADSDLVFGKPHNAPDEATTLLRHEVVVESYRPLNATVAEVRFFVQSAEFAFRPGQYMLFDIPRAGKAVRRSYSVSTPPSDKRHFEVCVRAVPGGWGSNYIHRMRPGNVLKVEGPYGKFVLNEESGKDILMIATGTGMAPIKSMMMHLLDKASARRVRVIFGVRHEDDLFYTDLLRGLKAKHPAFSYDITLSQPGPTWGGRRGRVTQVIDDTVRPEQAASTEVYLCGSRKMIEDSKARLRALGFSPDALHHENFY
jgi:ferredoxin-NADP reductase/ferredoxin